ncbi:MAG: hypothetical protein Q8K65_04115 [Alphaproteobacteria bacterium]|nr:hypothetical protein [Alphaproteobacteria bacterium]
MTYDSYEAADGAAALQNEPDMLQGNTGGDNGLVSKYFHLNDIISLSTGLMLAQEGSAALHRLVAFVMDCDATAAQTRANIETVKACLEEQLPFLEDLKLGGVYPIYKIDPSPTNPYLRVWLEMQALRFGDEHQITTFAAWQAQKNQNGDAAAANGNGCPAAKNSDY